MADSQPWNPSRATRNLIGVATLWPPIYFVFFLVSIGIMFSSISASGAHKEAFPGLFKILFPLHFFTMLLSLALTATYVVHAVKNPRLTQEMRIVWILILFFGNLFAFPVYWWIYLRSDRAESAQA